VPKVSEERLIRGIRRWDLVAIAINGIIGAGIFGALTPLIVADLMRGTGRYNLALGAVATVQGIGASLSGLSAGLIVDHFGYGIAFLTSGAVAGIALVFLLLVMPETSLSGACKAWLFPSAAAWLKIF